MYCGRQRGTLASPSVVLNGDTLCSDNVYAYDSTDYAVGAAIVTTVNGTPGNNTIPTKMSFQTANSAGTMTEQMNLTGNAINMGSHAVSGSIVLTQLAAPSGTPTGVASASGGTMTATNNYAKIAALDSAGSTIGSTESANVPTSGTTASIAWSWNAVPFAVSYRIYVGTTSGAEGNYGTSVTNSFTQTANAGSGNVATAGTPQTYNNTGQLTAVQMNANNQIVSRGWSTSSGSRTVWGGAQSTTAITIAAASVGGTTTYISNNAASGVTVTLAAPTGDGERRRIVFANASTGITWAFTASATAQAGLPTTVVIGQVVEMVYNSVAGTPTNSAATTWYQY
jgi:hypothetical protein